MLGGAEEDGPEGLPVLAAHQVVEDGVQGGGEKVEAARHVHQVLVECAIPSRVKMKQILALLSIAPLYVEVVMVVVGQALHMKGSPRNEEKGHHRPLLVGWYYHLDKLNILTQKFGQKIK